MKRKRPVVEQVNDFHHDIQFVNYATKGFAESLFSFNFIMIP